MSASVNFMIYLNKSRCCTKFCDIDGTQFIVITILWKFPKIVAVVVFLYFGIQVVLLRQHFSISASFYVPICVFSDFEDSLCSCSAVFKSQELLLISQQLSKVPGWFGLSFLCGGLSFQSPFKSWSFYSWWHGLLDLSSTNPWS